MQTIPPIHQLSIWWTRHLLGMPVSEEPRFLPQETVLVIPNAYLCVCVSYTANIHKHTDTPLYSKIMSETYCWPQCSSLIWFRIIDWPTAEPNWDLRGHPTAASWAKLRRAELGRGETQPANVWIKLSEAELSWTKRIRAGLSRSKGGAWLWVFKSVIRVLGELKLPLCNQECSGYFQCEGTHTFIHRCLVSPNKDPQRSTHKGHQVNFVYVAA